MVKGRRQDLEILYKDTVIFCALSFSSLPWLSRYTIFQSGELGVYLSGVTLSTNINPFCRYPYCRARISGQCPYQKL